MSNLTFDVTTATQEQLTQLVTIDLFAAVVQGELARRALADTFATDGATTPSGVHFTYLQALAYVQATLALSVENTPESVMAEVEFLRNAVLAILGKSEWKSFQHKWKTIQALILAATPSN